MGNEMGNGTGVIEAPAPGETAPETAPETIETVIEALAKEAKRDDDTIAPMLTTGTAAYDAAYKNFKAVSGDRKDAAGKLNAMHETAYNDCLAVPLNGTLKTASRDIRNLYVTRLKAHAEKQADKGKLSGEQRKIFASVSKAIEHDAEIPAKYYGKTGARKWYEDATASELTRVRNLALDAIKARFKDAKDATAFWNEIYETYKAKQ